MAVNLYDQPAESNILDTYVPINFDQLYRAASTQQAQIDRAVTDLSANVRRWSEFQSPSARDTENFYNLTIGALRGDIENLAANPDLMKTAAGRYALQSKINSLDYNQLANIQTSAQNLQQRISNISEMQARGLYNPNWDDIDIAGWDTLNPENGILTDVSPVQYMDYGQLTAPYTNLQDSYLGHRDPYSYFVGVDEDMLANAIGDNFDAITRTPQAQLHLRDIQRQFEASGIQATPEQVRQEFINRSIQAQQQVLRRNIQYDQAGLEQLRYSMQERVARIRRGQGQQDEQSVNYSPTEQLNGSVNKGMFENMRNNPLFQPLVEANAYAINQLTNAQAQVDEESSRIRQARDQARANGDMETYQRLDAQLTSTTNRLQQMANDADRNIQQTQYLTYGNALMGALGYAGQADANIQKLAQDKQLNAKDFQRASTEVIEAVASPVPVALINERFKGDFGRVDPVYDMAIGADAYNRPNSRGIVLPMDIAGDVANIPDEDKPGFEMLNKWRNGGVQSVQIVPGNKGYRYTDRNGQSHLLVSVEVYVPENEMKKLGRKGKAADFLNAQKVEQKVKDGDNRKYYRFQAFQPIQDSAQNNLYFDRNQTSNYGGSVESRGDRDYQAEVNFNN